jgi:hypothetical protein
VQRNRQQDLHRDGGLEQNKQQDVIPGHGSVSHLIQVASGGEVGIQEHQAGAKDEERLGDFPRNIAVEYQRIGPLQCLFCFFTNDDGTGTWVSCLEARPMA